MPRKRQTEYDSQYPFSIPPASPAKAARKNFAVYRIAINLPPNSLGYVASIGHPERRLEIINRMELRDGLTLIEARATGPGARNLAPLAKQVPAVVRFELHPESENSAVYRVTQKVPAVWRVIQHHKILTRYPIVVVDGWMRFETVATAPQIRDLMKTLTKEVGPSRVEAVRHGSVTPSALGLTQSQEAVFRTALATGYFSSPRRTSLTELAVQLGRSKSTVSQQLALIQRRLAESALRLRWAQLAYTG